MSEILPVVCIFGKKDVQLHSPRPVPHFEADKLDCRCYESDDNLYEKIAANKPSVIVSIGDREKFTNISNAPWNIRKRWIHFNEEDLENIGNHAFLCYIYNAVELNTEIPLVSVFTPVYNPGEKIMRPFNSLRAQNYSNWEWIIMDDSDDNGETFQRLQELASKDYRIKIFKPHEHTGIIGKLKKDACKLAEGEFLVELDHDDELTDFALDKVVKAFQQHPECGFVYTDFAECFEDCTPVYYGQNLEAKPPFSDWGFGYGSYRHETYNGQEYMVVNSPNINAKTIRHIVAAPNHIRAWRKSLYDYIGGHGSTIHVADDYEIMVRTFLNTRMCRVPYLCYVQYRNFETGNTHRERNKEIQRLVRYFSQYYDEKIHNRLCELGVSDFVYKQGEITIQRMMQIPNESQESHCSIVYKENEN